MRPLGSGGGRRDAARRAAGRRALEGLGLWAWVALVCACGSDQKAADANPDAAGAVEVAGGGTAGLGAGCTKNTDCASGLFCMQSEFAPSGWCTALCDTPGDYCAEPRTGGVPALCVQMPAGFQGPAKPFCTRRCDNTLQCTDVWVGWETCAKPAYKNTALYNDLPTKVCMSPASHGQVQVDPVLCDWQDKVTDPQFQAAKQVCKAYCTYLKTCQFFDANKENIDCCSWRCFQKMTPTGVVDDKIEDEMKCYTTAFFQAYANTPQVCTGPSNDCDGDPDPMRRK